MKRIYYKLSFVLFVCIVTSCDYLDVVPDNIATIDYAFRSRTMAEKYLYGCYSYRPMIGDVNYDAAMSASDEIWEMYLLSSGNGPYTWQGALIARGEQNTNSPILNSWDGERGLWTGIRDCNIFLENISNVKGDLTDYERKRWIAEIKFLKAYYHYCLLKRYGPIPIIDVNLPISADADEVRVYREPVDSVFNYITRLMKEVVVDLPTASELIEGSEAGRIDQLVALSMRAEVLLFAASRLFNGNTAYSNHPVGKLFNQTYEPNKWKIAADACKEAIDACNEQGKSLYDVVDPVTRGENEVFQLQTTYRQAICDRWNQELIWGGTNNNCGELAAVTAPRLVSLNRIQDILSTFSPTLKIVDKYYSSNGVPIDEDKDWQANNWYANRYKIRPEAAAGDEKYYVKEGEKTAYLHFNREPRFYASLGFDKGIYYGSGYYLFSDVKYVQGLNYQVSGYNASFGSSSTGYFAKKMHHFENSQTYNQVTWEYFPFPIMRLANLYLMYAEALNEAADAESNRDEAIAYLDTIRGRAGLLPVKVAWLNHSNWPSKPESQSGLREIIRQERTIELAFEGKRFWDIRRWGEIETLNETPKGWNVQGETAEDFYRVVSLPKEPVRFTVKDYFWPIMESNLYVNKNLIQNYGW